MSPENAELALTVQALSGRVDLLVYKVEQIQSSAGGFAGKVDLAEAKSEIATVKAELDGIMPSIKEMIKRDTEDHQTQLGLWRNTLNWAVLLILGFLLTAVGVYLGLKS